MKLGHTNDEIRYDATEGTLTRFVVILDGEPTMSILCDTADPEKTIRIAAGIVGSDALDEDTQATKGRFTVYTKLLESADGEPLGAEERVDRASVYRYAVPRLHVLLGRLLRAA